MSQDVTDNPDQPYITTSSRDKGITRKGIKMGNNLHLITLEVYNNNLVDKERN